MSESANSGTRRPEEIRVGDCKLAIWANKEGRSITISPRRYRAADGTWKDAASFRPGDLPALIFALQKALDYCYTVPLPAPTENGDAQPPI